MKKTCDGNAHQGSIIIRPKAGARDGFILSLDRGCIGSLDLLPGESCSLIARAGTAWVTMAGDMVDHVLKPSAPLHFLGPGRVVLEAVGESDLQFEWLWEMESRIRQSMGFVSALQD